MLVLNFTSMHVVMLNLKSACSLFDENETLISTYDFLPPFLNFYFRSDFS